MVFAWDFPSLPKMVISRKDTPAWCTGGFCKWHLPVRACALARTSPETRVVLRPASFHTKLCDHVGPEIGGFKGRRSKFCLAKFTRSLTHSHTKLCYHVRPKLGIFFRKVLQFAFTRKAGKQGCLAQNLARCSWQPPAS